VLVVAMPAPLSIEHAMNMYIAVYIFFSCFNKSNVLMVLVDIVFPRDQ
jgi:hypothetical protein